jgi:RNA polymerase primary sigma factor
MMFFLVNAPANYAVRRHTGDDEEESEGQLVEVKPRLPVKSGAKDPAERTDDPVRMYLREMSSADLLSREGEIAIAKRIEAGREAMIAGLCESPLTFQAIIIWRDELNNGSLKNGSGTVCNRPFKPLSTCTGL